jgi:hypothetical protein
MKILFLYKENPQGDANTIARRVHYGFVNKLNTLPRVELVIYGPGQNIASKLTPIPYNSKVTFSDLKRKLKPDMVLMYSVGNVREWIPRDFRNAQIPKVMVECDWWFVKTKGWYKEQGVSLIIQRGCVKTDVPKMRSVWLPFSAAEEDFVQFQKIKLKDRKHQIGFVGRGGKSRVGIKGPMVYWNRYKALLQLRENKLVKIKGEVGHPLYPSCISRFMCCFSDCGRLHSAPAKTFEIMASGSLLFTDPFVGYSRLFGDKEVCKFYNTDRSNIVESARHILSSNIDDLQRVVDRAVKVINEKHLDKHRIREFEYLLRNYLETGSVEKTWGQ